MRDDCRGCLFRFMVITIRLSSPACAVTRQHEIAEAEAAILVSYRGSDARRRSSTLAIDDNMLCHTAQDTNISE